MLLGQFGCQELPGVTLCTSCHFLGCAAGYETASPVAALGAICIEGMWGLYSLVCISLFMSIMFPSIYGIALENVDTKDTHLGAAFLVMAIVGGALMPPLQGTMIDQQVILGHPAVNISFILPLTCFLVIIVYGYRAFAKYKV